MLVSSLYIKPKISKKIPNIDIGAAKERIRVDSPDVNSRVLPSIMHIHPEITIFIFT